MKGNELIIVTWGAMVPRCLRATESFQGKVEILDLRTLIPWDQETVLESVRKTGKLLVVHKDTQTGGFAGEIIDTVVAKAFTYLDAPIERLATPYIPNPYNINMMNVSIPNVERISEKLAKILKF